MANNDDYIFREKIRHPSTDDWIISRDYGPINKIDISNPQTATIAETAFNVSAKSYNYIASGGVWVNNNDFITKESSSSLKVQENDKWDLISNNLIFNSVTAVTPTPNVTVTDFTNSYSNFIGYYGAGNNINNVSVTIKNTASAVWQDIMITKTLSTTLTSDHIKNDDTIIIPRVNSNNGFTFDAYIIDKTTNSGTGITTIPFTYDINNADDTDVLNILVDDDDNEIILSDMWASCQEIVSLTFDNEGILTSVIDTNGDSVTINSNNLYGNGVILNRFSKDTNFQGITFDYTWFIVEHIENTTSTRYILQLEYSSNQYKLKKLYQVNLSIFQQTHNITLQRANEITTYTDLPTFTIGWNSNAGYPGNSTDFSAYKIFGSYVINGNITISKNYNSVDTVSNTILADYNSQITAGVTPTVTYTDNTVLYMYSNTTQLNSINCTVSNSVYTGTISTTINNNTVSVPVSFTPNGNNINIVFTYNNNNLEKWWDYILNTNNTYAYDDIVFKFLLASRVGNITYTGNVSNVYSLNKIDNWSGDSSPSIYSINNLWNNIIVTTDDNINSNKIIISPHRLSYPTSSQTLTLTPSGKIWILLPDTQVQKNAAINSTNYFISVDKLKTTSDFINLVEDYYTDIEVHIEIPLGYQDIQYIIYQYANGMRMCDSEGNLLNIGDQWTPVFIKNGQFVACNDIRDIFIHTQDTQPSYGALWVDTDGS